VVSPDDMVITVCDAAHEELAAGGARRGTDLGRLHWSIPDPARTGQDQAFDRVVTDLTDRVARVAPAIRSAHQPAPGGLDAG
jgi:protein-tyrosine-phosphatase